MATAQQEMAVSTPANGATPRDETKIAVKSPVDGSVVGHVSASVPADVSTVVERVRKAQHDWDELGIARRAEQLFCFRDALIDRQDELVDLLCAETGKVSADAYLEVVYVADAISHYARKCKKYLADRHPSPSSLLLKTKKLGIVYRPVGVVGLIGPWNFPVILTIGDAIPALLAGNAVVIKPATLTPLSVQFARDLWRQVTGHDVLETVAGAGGEIGSALIDACDYIGFTGSTQVGKQVMAMAAKTLTPVSLELGGNDAMIVLADANIERAANGAAAGGLTNCGQVCMSVERIYVEEPAYDQFVKELVERVSELRQGAGDWSLEVGNMTSEAQLETVRHQVDDAVEHGARPLTGGRVNTSNGRLAYAPTVLADVTQDMEIMREETFGPVLPVMKVRDVDEAVRLANDSRYGLSGSVWTRDKKKGEQIARRLETGSVCVNDVLINYFAMEIPFGGWKQSGIGARHGGADGIRKFCKTESILIDRTGMKKEILWYPNSKGKAKLLKRLVRVLYGRGLGRKLGR